jgi:hypothetical protein
VVGGIKKRQWTGCQMSQNYGELAVLTKELFPLGQHDLDLGLYGVITPRALRQKWL